MCVRPAVPGEDAGQYPYRRFPSVESVITPAEAHSLKPGVTMSSHQFVNHRHRGHVRHVRRHRGPSALVRYSLLAPPSHLAPEEAAALLRLPRRVLRAEHEWFALASAS
ncbi:hypothetical protein LuPra_05138 [Luteitalea pratensis]|uniref:Uncharacterized protein n=1 Tax=Luteitalea pratensis TaxID=1855912 RepID=A0A143PU11_LUTPR|nr:hypothetical protein LuPra_05138 [Luteitalea pratensis]